MFSYFSVQYHTILLPDLVVFVALDSKPQVNEPSLHCSFMQTAATALYGALMIA